MTKTIKSISRIWFGWVGRRRPRTVVLLSVFVMMFILGVMLGGYTSVNEFKETYLTLNAKFLNTSDNLLITSFVMVYASAALFFTTLGIFAGENLRWIPKEVMWPMLQVLSFTPIVIILSSILAQIAKIMDIRAKKKEVKTHGFQG